MKNIILLLLYSNIVDISSLDFNRCRGVIDMGYLECEKCGLQYELKDNESAEDFSDECDAEENLFIGNH